MQSWVKYILRAKTENIVLACFRFASRSSASKSVSKSEVCGSEEEASESSLLFFFASLPNLPAPSSSSFSLELKTGLAVPAVTPSFDTLWYFGRGPIEEDGVRPAALGRLLPDDEDIGVAAALGSYFGAPTSTSPSESLKRNEIEFPYPGRNTG